MSNESLVLIDRRSDGVALVTLNSPKVNALSTALLARLHEVARELTSNPAGAVVITGGDRLFAAGADISEFGGPSEAKTIGAAFHAALNAVAAIPSFTIAAAVANCRWHAITELPQLRQYSVNQKFSLALFLAVAERNVFLGWWAQVVRRKSWRQVVK
jgi:hypothetical protein